MGAAKRLLLTGPRPLLFPPVLAPLPLRRQMGCRPGESGWGSSQHRSRKLRRPANNEPVPVFRNSTRAPDSASYCLLRAGQTEVGLLAGLGAASSVLINTPSNNGKVVECSWKRLLFEGSHQFQTKNQLIKLLICEGS